MKHEFYEGIYNEIIVAPFVGAWIETSAYTNVKNRCVVAPFVGAWIETSERRTRTRCSPVAPFVGAWIETDALATLEGEHDASHPSWVRGLKHGRGL